MKITVINGAVCAQAETEADVIKLFAMKNGKPLGRPKKMFGVVVKKGKYKNSYRTKVCELCGKGKFKRLGKHMQMAHPEIARRERELDESIDQHIQRENKGEWSAVVPARN